LWIAHAELASAPGHPFYQRLNELLEAERFNEFVETRCAKFYAGKNGRPSLTPGIYFRALLIGYFEGIGAERGIAWRLADSLALRRIVGIAPDEYTPDHSTISRTRRLIDLDTHREVFGWVLGVLFVLGMTPGSPVTRAPAGRAFLLKKVAKRSRSCKLPTRATLDSGRVRHSRPSFMWLPSLHSSWIRLGFYQEGDEGTSVEPERDVVQDSLAPMTLRLQIKDLGGLMNQLAAERDAQIWVFATCRVLAIKSHSAPMSSGYPATIRIDQNEGRAARL
jgi:transposase